MERTSNNSWLAILLSNAFSIGLAILQNWDLRPLLIIYWAQSTIIGVFNFIRMIRLQRFTTDGLTSNGKPVPETPQGKRNTAIFFAFHYGFFHLGYAVFVFGIALGGSLDKEFGGPWEPWWYEILSIVLAIAAFLGGHWVSFQQNVEADIAGCPNLGTMMFLPYARIVPMHVTIIFGTQLESNRNALLLFLLLKTGADLLMHVVEHRILQNSTKA